MQTLMKRAATTAIALAGLSQFALAQDAPQQAVLNGADTAWILVATCLVLMMTVPGLALFYAGLVRKKNVLSTMMQSFAATCLVALLWIFFGYSFAFTGTGAWIGGTDRLFLQEVQGRGGRARARRGVPCRRADDETMTDDDWLCLQSVGLTPELARRAREGRARIETSPAAPSRTASSSTPGSREPGED